MLSGFPLGRPEFLTQLGNVSGTGLVLDVDPIEEMKRAIERKATQAEMQHINKRTQKKLRVFVSVVSNPANSGGPVLNESGKLIGLLQGNLLSPARDESDRDAIYLRPKRNDAGEFVLDEDGKNKFELAKMLQNSGLSIIIPTMYVMDLLKQIQ